MQSTATPSTFGARLAAMRKTKGLTQDQLGEGLAADGSNMGKAAVSSWENDRTQPNQTQITKLCQRLQCSADELLGLERAQ